MLRPWLEVSDIAAQLRAYGKASGVDLVELGTNGSAETLKHIEVAQPLIVALGVAIGQHLGVVGEHLPLVVTGHSVGELTAAAVAGVLTAQDAVAFAARRGEAMAAACARTPTGMSAVMGATSDEALGCVAAAGLVAANHNGGGQIVAAGTHTALERLSANAPSGSGSCRWTWPARFTPSTWLRRRRR